MSQATGPMTEQDLADGSVLADKVLELIKDVRPATAVAGLCMALAAVAQAAKCGPGAVIGLFQTFYRHIDQLQRQREPSKE